MNVSGSGWTVSGQAIKSLPDTFAAFELMMAPQKDPEILARDREIMWSLKELSS